jgi:protein gp37
MNHHKGNYTQVGNMAGEWNGEVICDETKLNIPRHWRQPRRIFVCSMCDLFHPKVPFEFTGEVFETICKCQQHIFQILTKRPQRMAEWVGDFARRHGWFYKGRQQFGQIAKHVWLGVSICVPEEKPKIDTLRKIPAAVKFISFEPLLADMGQLDLTGIDWVIVGGESGPRARAMHPDWARGIRDQCKAAGVAFFFKQWGAWIPRDHFAGCQWKQKPTSILPRTKRHLMGGSEPESGMMCYRVGKKAAGCLLDGKKYKEYPK